MSGLSVLPIPRSAVPPADHEPALTDLSLPGLLRVLLGSGQPRARGLHHLRLRIREPLRILIAGVPMVLWSGTRGAQARVMRLPCQR